jgi:hypothetical protein
MADEWCRLENREGAAEAIRRMGEEDLLYLNRLIVERLQLIAQARSTALLSRFSVGDRVGFPTSSGERKTGIILKLNKKTAAIQTDDKQQWNVGPAFLRPASQDRDIVR